MLRRIGLLGLIIFLMLAVSAAAVDKRKPTIVKANNPQLIQLRESQSFASADTCSPANFDSVSFWIDGWVVGDELYKVYFDPGFRCAAPYPFTITEIHFAMHFAGATPIIYSGDIEDVDYTDPGCPFPGPNMVAISSSYQSDVPGEGLYDIWVPLDPPLVVEEPFFAGFYIAEGLNPSAAPAVCCGSTPVICDSYNVWDEQIGFIDLCSNEYWLTYDSTDWKFPGRLCMWCVGYQGGSGPSSGPAVQILSPTPNQDLMGTANLWAKATATTHPIDFVTFEYSSGGMYTEIGRDFDGFSPLRDGVSNAPAGRGFSMDWDFSFLSEGNRTIKVTAYDTLGECGEDSVTVYLEPTPPTPTITIPANGSDFCNPLELTMTCPDEDMARIEVQRRPASYNYSTGLTPYLVPGAYQNTAGASVVAIKKWYDRGYTALMQNGSSTMSMNDLFTTFIDIYKINTNFGTYDEDVILGLREYIDSHGGNINIDYKRNPSYFDLRNWVEEEERVVMIAINGQPGIWLTIDGFKGWKQPTGDYIVSVMNPPSGTLMDLPILDVLGSHNIYYKGVWHPIEMAVSLHSDTWTVNRSYVGADFNSSDGWFLSWTPQDLNSDSLYYFRTVGIDAGQRKGTSTVILNYACTSNFTPGDYNNDGSANLTDLYYLVSFITNEGPEPQGGPERADANGDGFVNVGDIVYFMNYVFGSVNPPSY